MQNSDMDERIILNKNLCEKYPFLVPRNRFSGEVVENYDYSYTELDEMPDGWRKAFGEQICEEIQRELNKLPDKDRLSYRILQIKEKFGYLRWYTNWSTIGLDNIIRKYEQISERTCIKCGAAATKISNGWISPWCDECAKEVIKCDNLINIEDYFNEEDKDDEETSI